MYENCNRLLPGNQVKAQYFTGGCKEDRVASLYIYVIIWYVYLFLFSLECSQDYIKFYSGLDIGEIFGSLTSKLIINIYLVNNIYLSHKYTHPIDGRTNSLQL